MKFLFLLVLFLISSFFVSAQENVQETFEEIAAFQQQEKEEDFTLERPESVELNQVQEAWNKALPQAGIYRLPYSKDHVMRLRTRPFMITTIVLPEWEEIMEVLLGDDYFFAAEKKNKNIISLLSKEALCDTSLTIIGKNGNIYPFYVRAEKVLSTHIPDIVVYVDAKQERNPYFEIGPPLKEEVTDYLNKVPFLPENLNFSLEMFQKDLESRAIAPQRVYTDGIWTWLDYGDAWDKKALPAVYQNVDGVDTPVNTRVENTKIIVHGVPPLTLKNGQKVICVQETKD